jgi:hypothetical protein
MAWMVAHLMVATGNMQKGTRVDVLMRTLLGREPGTVPGETPTGARPSNEMTPAETTAHLKAWIDGLKKQTPRGRARVGA